MSFDKDYFWESVSGSHEATAHTAAVVHGKVASATWWPFLSHAADEADFENRLSIVSNKIEAAVDPEVYPEVVKSLRDDFRAVYEASRSNANSTSPELAEFNSGLHTRRADITADEFFDQSTGRWERTAGYADTHRDVGPPGRKMRVKDWDPEEIRQAHEDYSHLDDFVEDDDPHYPPKSLGEHRSKIATNYQPDPNAGWRYHQEYQQIVPTVNNGALQDSDGFVTDLAQGEGRSNEVIEQRQLTPGVWTAHDGMPERPMPFSQERGYVPVASLNVDPDGFVVESNKYIKQQGGKWVITQKGTGKVLSHHDSEGDAEASFRAMMQSKHGAYDFRTRTRLPGLDDHLEYHDSAEEAHAHADRYKKEFGGEAWAEHRLGDSDHWDLHFRSSVAPKSAMSATDPNDLTQAGHRPFPYNYSDSERHAYEYGRNHFQQGNRYDATGIPGIVNQSPEHMMYTRGWLGSPMEHTMPVREMERRYVPYEKGNPETGKHVPILSSLRVDDDGFLVEAYNGRGVDQLVDPAPGTPQRVNPYYFQDGSEVGGNDGFPVDPGPEPLESRSDTYGDVPPQSSAGSTQGTSDGKGYSRSYPGESPNFNQTAGRHSAPDRTVGLSHNNYPSQGEVYDVLRANRYAPTHFIEQDHGLVHGLLGLEPVRRHNRDYMQAYDRGANARTAGWHDTRYDPRVDGPRYEHSRYDDYSPDEQDPYDRSPREEDYEDDEYMANRGFAHGVAGREPEHRDHEAYMIGHASGKSYHGRTASTDGKIVDHCPGCKQPRRVHATPHGDEVRHLHNDHVRCFGPKQGNAAGSAVGDDRTTEDDDEDFDDDLRATASSLPQFFDPTLSSGSVHTADYLGRPDANNPTGRGEDEYRAERWDAYRTTRPMQQSTDRNINTPVLPQEPLRTPNVNTPTPGLRDGLQVTRDEDKDEDDDE